MLPSRGALRTGQALRLRQMSRDACARHFGTAPRRAAAPASLSVAQLAGRRPRAAGAVIGSRPALPASAAAFSLSSLNPWRSSKKPEAATEAAAAPSVETAAEALPAEAAAPPAPPFAETSPSSTPPAADAASAVDTAALDPDLSQILDGAALLDMPEQIGYLHALGLDFGWGPSSMCQWLLEHVHIYTGLPWWASIAATVFLFRAAIFLPSLAAAEQSAIFQRLRQDPKYSAYMAQMQDAMMRKDTAASMEARMQMKRMQAAVGHKLWKMFIPMINIPFGFGMFRLLRSMTTLPVPSLEDSGILWFTDLTVPDPYFILPIASAGVMFLIFRSNIRYMAPEQAQMMKMMQVVITPVSILVTARMDAGLTFFFFFSSLLQMVQTWLWHQPWLREWKGLPPLESLIVKKASPTTIPASYRLAPESSWQAPRAVSKPAADLPDPAATSDEPSAVDVVKKGWDKVMGQAKDKQSATKTKQYLQKAQEYEAKRAMEEEESLYRRREAERQYREMKKAIARGEAGSK